MSRRAFEASEVRIALPAGGYTSAGWIDAEGATIDEEDGPGWTEPRSGTADLSLTFSAESMANAFWGPPPSEDDPIHFRVSTRGERPMLARRRKLGTERRVDHARHRRMMAWANRRWRRHGIPPRTLTVQTVLPYARLLLAPDHPVAATEQRLPVTMQVRAEAMP